MGFLFSEVNEACFYETKENKKQTIALVNRNFSAFAAKLLVPPLKLQRRAGGEVLAKAEMCDRDSTISLKKGAL